MSKIQKVNFLDSYDIPVKILEAVLENNPCNNGYSMRWTVEDPNDINSGYPEMHQFLIDEGLSIGDELYIRINW